MFYFLTVFVMVLPFMFGKKYHACFQGKPSAGKSTFFNACTTLDMAKTGAHPFTTIEPNIGKAFYSIPCPCSSREKICDAGMEVTLVIRLEIIVKPNYIFVYNFLIQCINMAFLTLHYK